MTNSKPVRIPLPFGKGPSSICQVRNLVRIYRRKMKQGKQLSFEDGVRLEDHVEWLFDKNHPHIARWISQLAAFWDYVTVEKLDDVLIALNKRRLQHKVRKAGISKAQ